MRERREPRDADTQEAKVTRMCVQEVQGNHDPVIERGISPADGPRLDALRRSHGRKLLCEHAVIACCHRDLGRTELTEAARRLLARCDVEVVGVHDRVRAHDDDRIGGKIRCLLHRTLVGIYRQLDLLLLAPPDLGDDERRMGDDIGCKDRHRTTSLRNSICLLIRRMMKKPFMILI